MANKRLFQSVNVVAPATTTNAAGGKAYQPSAKNSLARLAVTGTLGTVFYASPESQLDQINQLVTQVDPQFVAKLAIYSRNQGLMKDLPAVLLAHYVINTTDEFDRISNVFNRIVNNGKMLRNFVQIMRSGQLGRKSLGTRSKRLVQQWLVNREPEALFKDSIGNDPSLRDVFMLAHPKAKNKTQEALFKYIIDGTYSSKLPTLVKEYEKWKEKGGTPPAIPFEMLSSRKLELEDWGEIIHNLSWSALRQNLNTLQRNGVFDNKKLCSIVADRLSDPAQLPKYIFPYQVFTAWKYGSGLPADIIRSLEDALAHSCKNVTICDDSVAVLLDVSFSMSDPVTGKRGTKDTVIRNIDVASLFTSVIADGNAQANIYAFNDKTRSVTLDSRNSIAQNTQHLSNLLSGGTDCGQALAYLNSSKCPSPVVFMISDNQSWISRNSGNWRSAGTDAMNEWDKYQKRVKGARLICWDISPEGSSQFTEHPDVLNIGGFSDNIFTIISKFLDGTLGSFVEEIEKISLDRLERVA